MITITYESRARQKLRAMYKEQHPGMKIFQEDLMQWMESHFGCSVTVIPDHAGLSNIEKLRSNSIAYVMSFYSEKHEMMFKIKYADLL